MTNAATKPRADGWQKLFRRKLLRNELIGVIVFGVLFAFNFPASAQQQKKNTKIGFIGVRPDAANYSAKFIVRELENLGYVEGNGFHFEYRTADNQIDRLPDLVDQLIRLKIDVLITAATPETKMAQKATKDIPIVSLNLGDPVGLRASKQHGAAWRQCHGLYATFGGINEQKVGAAQRIDSQDLACRSNFQS